MKLSISLDEDLVRRIDECAKRNSISRSGFLAIAANQYLSQQQFFSSVPDMVSLMKFAVEQGMISAEEQARLEEKGSVS